LNDNFFSSLSQTQSITVPGQSELLYTVNIKTPALNALYSIVKLFTQKLKMKVSFEGTVNSDGLLLPLSQSVTLF
jgi:hypothetical protein